MRQLAEGKIRWCFYPPISEADNLRASTLDAASDPPAEQTLARNTGSGIWLADHDRRRASDSRADPQLVRSAVPCSSSESESTCSTSSTLGSDSRRAESKLDSDGEENEHYDDDDDRSTASAKYLKGGFFAVLDSGAADDGQDEEDDSR